MLRLLLIALFPLFTAATCFAQFPYKDYGPKPKGKIDSVITSSSYGKTIAIFNKKGQLVEFYEYTHRLYEFGIVRDSINTFYNYDKKGLLSKSISFNTEYYPGHQPSHRTDTTIWHLVKESNGYLAKFDHFKDGTTRHTTFKLNSALQLIEETDSVTYVDDKTYVEDKLNTYNKNGYLVKWHRTSKSRGEIFNYDEYYTNDADGNIIVKATNRPTFKFTYTRYDKMHNWLGRNTYKPDTEDGDYLLGELERRITYYK